MISKFDPGGVIATQVKDLSLKHAVISQHVVSQNLHDKNLNVIVISHDTID